MLRYAAILPLLVAAGAAHAQAPVAAPRIEVTGTGSVSTPPNRATIAWSLRGEGATPDAATAAVQAKNKAVAAGVGGFLGAGTRVTASGFVLGEVRGEGCDANGGYPPRVRLSAGACAVVGYVAALQGEARTGAVDKAATAAGLAGRLGATDARVTGYALADPAAAQRAAVAEALGDARGRADAIATGSGARLGALVSVRDQDTRYRGDIVVTASRVEAAPPPPPPPSPIAVDAKPAPIETVATVYVSYALER